MKDSEIAYLIKRAQNHDEQAIENLLRIFMPKVTAIAREYFLIGAGTDDLLQEGMIALYKAITIYDENKNNNFGVFASLCIHRQLQNAVKLANRKKNNPLNTYLPINNYDGTSLSEDEQKLSLVIADDSDIEQQFINREMSGIILDKLQSSLNNQQFEILKMFLNGESYLTMAQTFKTTPKKIDNTIQAIKKKLKSIKGDLS